MILIRTLAAVVLLAFSSIAMAAGADITREDIIAWIAQGDAHTPPAGGSELGAGSDAITAFLPPGYASEYDFPEVRLAIQATAHFAPHHSYIEATLAHAGKAQLAPDGEMLNYVAGLPFDPSQFDAVDPAAAGYMIAWNHIHRWQYCGWLANDLTMYYLQPASGGGQLRQGFSGGGHIDRYVSQSYQRVYLSHLAMLPEAGYKIDIEDAGGYLYKDHMRFNEPFDVKGTEFVIERAQDPHEPDQINSYLPSERRVRRLSAKERADRFMGADMTMDDFEGFSGQGLHYKWRYLGRRQVLAVADSKGPTLAFFGPKSRVPDDVWQIRPTYAVEIVSTWDGHPYSSKILFVDTETYNVTVGMAFNRDGQLWRIVSPLYWLPEPEASGSAAIETSVQRWAATVAIDRLADTATISRATKPTEMPTMSVAQIKRRFSVSNLTSGH